MEIRRIKKKGSEDNKKSAKAEKAVFKAKTNEELNAQNPTRKNRRQATEAELNDPLHGVKLAQILERLVDHYGWEYLAYRVNIRCFKYNPNMKSSLGFLRKFSWAREHVEDLYVNMVKEEREEE